MDSSQVTNSGNVKAQLRLRPAVPADVDTLVDIFLDAFSGDPMHRLMHPHGSTESARALFGSHLLADKRPPTGEMVINVAELVPSDANEEAEVVAFAKWLIWREPRAEEDWNKEPKPATREDMGEGVDLAMAEWFVTGLLRERARATKGDPCIVLEALASRPGRSRMGAGTALVEQGLDMADKEGLPVFVESSPGGYRLYARLGFEPFDKMDFDVTQKLARPEGAGWGQDLGQAELGALPEGWYRIAFMKRMPRLRPSCTS